MNTLISLFIDDELQLDDKVSFVRQIHRDSAFYEETIDLLQQETHLEAAMVASVPDVDLKTSPGVLWPRFRSAALAVPVLAAAVLLVFLLVPRESPHLTDTAPYRFVFYRPDARTVEITGSFTQWRSVPMHRTGSKGYWEIILNIPPGEHRFSYLIEGNQRAADPTIPKREPDDFGGENSILVLSS